MWANRRSRAACCSSRATEQGNRGYVETGHSPPGLARRRARRQRRRRGRARMGRAPSRRPNAARTRWSGRVHAVPISAAASSTARVDLSVAMGGWRAAALSGAVAPGSSGPGSVSRPCWNALRSVSSLRPRCSATSLRLQPAPSNCCAWAVTSGVITVRRVSHETCRTLSRPRRDTCDAANDALLGDAEGSHDIHLAAGTLADQLGSEHPKRLAVGLGVMKDWLSAAEVCP